MTPDPVPPPTAALRWQWLLSGDVRVRSHTIMSGLGWLLMVCCALIALGVAAVTQVPMQAMAIWAGVSLSLPVLAVVCIRAGRTRRLSDPAIVVPQVLWALSSAACAFVLVPAARDMLLGTVAIALLFGGTGLQLRQIYAISGYAVLAMGAAMVVSALQAPVTFHNYVQAAMMLVLIAACLVISWRLQQLNARLQRKRGELAQALQEHQELASRDPLTGLPNRRSMNDLLEFERLRCLRGSRTMALAMLDLDHFKRINDTYGHAMGDRALQAFAQAVRHTVRGGDVMARWGGEEFVLLLSDLDMAQAQHLLRRITEAVAQAHIEGAPAHLQIRVSAGLAPHLPGERIEATLERADRALYRAKQQGRNCIVVESASESSAAAGPTPEAVCNADGERRVSIAWATSMTDTDSVQGVAAAALESAANRPAADTLAASPIC